ncbi:DinB family protein [uncultured Chitinophaga sp.]|jgi:Protein of unknown function (DUF1569).|uniref:DinB family protein n=1 Tax=uncultured Chitinophaga sp. TaxID=339340 RepID=UPI002622C3E2|nr:DinB family protein [uncultured Chitinophaga sp.]
MQTTAILKSFDDSFNILLQLIAAFPQDRLNTVPFEGSWTGAQVARHLQKSSPAGLLYGHTGPTERQPDMLVAPLRQTFLDFTVKFKAPEVLEPENVEYVKENLLSELEITAAAIRKGIQTLDLSVTCLDWEMPQTGYLTRLEWVSFYTVHTQRHTRQLQNIFETVIRKTYA